MTPPRRDKTTIIIDILGALIEKDLKPTHLLYKSNLSHIRLKFYLSELVKQGLVEEIKTKDGGRCRITQAGVEAYNRYHKVRDFTHGFGV